MCSGQRRKLSPHRYDRKSGLLEARESSSSSPSPHDPSSCSVDDFHNTLAKHEIEEGLDADLVPMEYTIFNEDGSEEKGMTLVYKRPHISTYYNSTDTSMQAVKPKFVGFAGKFFNLSPWTVELVWDGGPAHQVPMSIVGPFQAHGMGTFPRHKFFFRKHGKRGDVPTQLDEIVKRFVADPDDPLNFYDAVADGHVDLEELSSKERELYYGQLTNLDFTKKYKEFTGSEWLAMFPKARPTKKMWRADYFGQHHSVVTNETQFISPPPSHLLSKISYNQMKASDVLNERIRSLDAYRQTGLLTLNLTVLSCAPRVFEIKNFLSKYEASHLLEFTDGLAESSVAGGSQKMTKIRTSQNTWVTRTSSPIVDAVYRRAADLLQIDEALLRFRGDDDRDISNTIGTHASVAEKLQLVHYENGQEYTAHHDFSYPNSDNDWQPARFATLLLYLNEGMEGGETSFPRWMNAETSARMDVVPEIGKAVLFYSTLPDGNNDDLSQHAAQPVKRGEKWLTNLWVWDPVMNA